MKSYSLLTLILVVVIAALTVSHIVMMRQLADARAEVESIRRRFGHIRVDDESRTYVARITEPNEPTDHAYRIRVPAGSRYLLHLSDTPFVADDYPPDPVPTKTISLNGWRDGADVVLSYSIRWEKNAPRVIIHTQTEEMFDYVPPDWTSGGPSGWSHLQTDPQVAFSTDETIRFMRWHDATTKRGFMVWLEPFSKWNDRRLAQKAAAEQRDEAQPQ
jgi:hypothetical protein